MKFFDLDEMRKFYLGRQALVTKSKEKELPHYTLNHTMKLE